MVEDNDLMKVQARLSKLERDLKTLALSFEKFGKEMAEALKNIQDALVYLPLLQKPKAFDPPKYHPFMFFKKDE